MEKYDEAHASLRPMYFVWIWLLVLTAVEVLLAYLNTPLLIMLGCLLGFSFVKAALIVSYFMHLKFERISLVYTIVPGMIMCMLLMNIIFGDSVRLKERGVFRDLPPPQPTAVHHDAGGGE